MNGKNKLLLLKNLYSEVIYHRVFHLFTSDTEAYFTASISLLQFLSFMGTGIFYTESKQTNHDAGTAFLRKIFFLFTMMDPIDSTDSELFFTQFVGAIFLIAFVLFHFLLFFHWIFGNPKLPIPKGLRTYFAFYSFYYPNFIHFILQDIALVFLKKFDLSLGIQITLFCLIGIGNIEAFLMLIYTNDTIYVRNLLARKKLTVNYVEYIFKGFLSYFVIFQAESMEPFVFRIILNITIFIMICICLSQPTFYYPKMFTLSLSLRTMTQILVFFPLLYSNFLDTKMEFLTWPYISIAFLIVLKIAINARKGVFYPIVDHIWNPTSVNDALNCYFQAFEMFTQIQFTTHTNKDLTQSELCARGLLRHLGHGLLSDENIQYNNKVILKSSLEREQLIELKDLVLENLMRRYYHKFNSQILGFNLLTKMILNESKVNYSQIVTLLHTLRKFKWTFYQQALIDMLVKMLKSSKRDDKHIDVDNIIKFEQKYNKLSNFVIEEGKLHAIFWENCQKNIISVEKIFDLSEKINNLNSKITTVWSKIQKKNIEKGAHYYFLYSFYETFIRNDSSKATELANAIHRLNNTPQLETINLITPNVLSDFNTVITISGDPRNIGEILFCSDGIRNLLGYEVEDVIRKNVNQIVPQIIQSRHHAYIQRFIDTNDGRIIDKNLELFAVNNEGFLIPTYVIVKFYPFSHLGLTFTGIFRKIEDYGDVMVFSKDGKFAGCTKNISRKLGLNVDLLHNSKIVDIFAGINDILEEQIKLFFPFEYPKYKAAKNMDGLEIVDDLVNKYPEEVCKAFDENTLILQPKARTHPKFSTKTEIKKLKTFEFTLAIHRFTEFNFFVFRIVSSQLHKATKEAESQKKMYTNVSHMHTSVNKDDSDFMEIPCETKANFFEETIYRKKTTDIQQFESDNIPETHLTENVSVQYNYIHTDKKVTARPDQRFVDQKSAQSSKISGENKSNQNLKLAINESYQPISIKFLQSSLIIFVVLSIAFFFVLGFYGEHSVSAIKSGVDILSVAELRQDSLIEYHRRARLIDITLKGLLPLDRHTLIGVPNYLNYLVTRFSLQSDLLLKYNHQFLGNLSSLQSSIKEVLFEKNVNLDYTSKLDSRSGLNMIEKRNSFDATEELAWAGFPITKKIETLKSYDPDLQFILKNSLNDLLFESEHSLKLLDQSINDKLLDFLTLIQIIFGIVIALGIFILGGSIIYNAMVYRRIIRLFMEAFIKLNLDSTDKICDEIGSIITHISRVKKRDINKWNKSHVCKTQVKKKEKSKIGYDKKRKYSIGSMLRKPLKDALTLFTIVIASTLMIIIILQKFDTFYTKSTRMENRIIYSITDLASMGIAMTGAYEFVSEDMSTSIYDQPIVNIIDSLISKIGNIQETFDSYSNDGIEIDSRYKPFMTDDLCLVATTSINICLIDEQINNDGILGVKSYISRALNALVEKYKKSDKSTSTKQQLFLDKDLVSAERILTITVRPAYLKLQDLLKNDFVIYLSEYQNETKDIVIISILIMLILPTLVLNYVMKKLLNQYDKIKMILKPIPAQMLIENKMMMSVIKKLSPKSIFFYGK